jgi:Protein of unknown function (DUF2937)
MRRALSLVGGAGLGLALSQFPEFSQQYEQRLGGAVDELRIIVTDFDAAAARQGLDRTEALARYRENPDTFIVGRGADMDATIARYERLSASLAALQQADPVERVLGFAEYYDSEIGARALDTFEPAVPATAEGAAYAGVGFLGGYGLLSGLIALGARPFRRRNRA